MSISPIGGPTRQQVDDDNQTTGEDKRSLPKEFDFSGPAHAHVNLPTGAIAHAAMMPTAATIRADADDLEKKIVAFHYMLASPQMKEALSKNSAAMYTLLKMETKIAAIVGAIAILKQVGLAGLGALRYAKEVAGAAASIVAIPEDLAKFTSQLKEALPTIGPAVAPIMMSAAEVTTSAMKLAADARLLGVR